jgi:hypothetical protein
VFNKTVDVQEERSTFCGNTLKRFEIEGHGPCLGQRQNLVCEEPAVEIVDCAVWVICVGVVFEALVHIVKQPHADYGNKVPFYTIAEEEMLIIDINNVLSVYTKIQQVHLQQHQYINKC